MDEVGFITDSAVCRKVQFFGQRYHGPKERPLAAYIPPPGTVGWQLPLLAERYDVAIISDEIDPLLERAAERFDAAAYASSLPSTLEGHVDFAVMTFRDWHSPGAFFSSLNHVSAWLAEGGVMLAVVAAKTREGARVLCRSTDNNGSLITELHRGVRPQLELHETLTLEIAPARRQLEQEMDEFLRRHQSFFGRNVREYLEERMRAPDFPTDSSLAADTAAVLVYEAR